MIKLYYLSDYIIYNRCKGEKLIGRRWENGIERMMGNMKKEKNNPGIYSVLAEGVTFLRDSRV